MRIFLAINIPNQIKDILLKEMPRFDYLKFRQIPKENWHITIKFIGDADKESLQIVKNAVSSVVKSFKPFKLVIRDIGFLNKRIFAFNLERSRELFTLFRMVDQCLSSKGVCKVERFREFAPHITVGRKAPPIRRDLHSVKHFDLKNKDVISFKAESLDIMESILLRHGALYKVLDKFKFTA